MISWIAWCPVFQSPDYYGTGHRPEALTDGGASVAQSTGYRAQGIWHRAKSTEPGVHGTGSSRGRRAGNGGIGMGFVVGY